MARPKKAAGVPTAKEAIESEFWRLYLQRPLDKISVREVCEAAGCNKTTFYYHFEDLRHVLKAIEDDCLPLEAPDMLAGLVIVQDRVAYIAECLEGMGERFERYCVLLSSRGDPDFAKRAREIMVQRWCAKLGIEYAALAEDCRMAIRFAVGGAGSVFADHGEGAPFDAEAFADVGLSVFEMIARRLPGRCPVFDGEQAAG